MAHRRRPAIIDAVVVLAAAGLVLAVLLGLAKAARAADAEYCRVYAREFLRVAVAAAAPDAKLKAYLQARAWTRCLNADIAPTLPLVDGTVLALPPGTIPAGERVEAPATSSLQPAGAEACRRAYRSFDPATGTVIRRGSKRRVPCPLMEP